MIILLFCFFIFVRVNTFYMLQPPVTTKDPIDLANNTTIKDNETVNLTESLNEPLPKEKEDKREEMPPFLITALDALKRYVIDKDKSSTQNSTKALTYVSPFNNTLIKDKDVEAETTTLTPKKSLGDTFVKTKKIKTLNNNMKSPHFSKEPLKESLTQVNKIETTTKITLLVEQVSGVSSNVSEIANISSNVSEIANIVEKNTYTTCDSDSSSPCKSAQGCNHQGVCTYMLILASSLYFYHTTQTF